MPLSLDKHSAGLGLRREMLPELLQLKPADIDFFEVAPENWLPYGGKLQRDFRRLTEQYPFFCHGLSLSIASPDPLDVAFVKQVKQFLDEHQILQYSEHLSYCSADGHLYDLMPIPFTEEAIHYVSGRIKQVQDILERPLILENVSYYVAPDQQLSEQHFLQAVLEEADCQLLLDVNNIYVNAVNHGYDANTFLQTMPTERIAYYHVAGHYQQTANLLIDTHGADVPDPVWQLLQAAYQHHGVKPTLYERDFNVPAMTQLCQELRYIKQLQHAQRQLERHAS
ncbi:HvfB family MNIO-type RiPP peptide maturase [Alishewanella sp. HL-SH06]|uniref:HvfB family MNIO-type RiPP peptide maturase n=1 Tax=Alishewanella sp. HL-SH06 TaxID=3461144 RepID=UPI004041D56D